MDVDTDTGSIYLHNKSETAKHLVMKALLALHLQQRGRPWGTEVDVGNGVVDVLDWGPPDAKAIAFEIETGCTPERKRQKVAQYTNWIVRDVIVLKPEDAPDEIPKLYRWVGCHVTG